MTRVAGGGSGGGGGSLYPPSGTLNIKNGGNANAAPFTVKGDAFAEFGGAADDSGNTLFLGSENSGSYLYAYLEDNSTGIIQPVTLSGFGTFSSQPLFHILGYDIENDNYWIIFDNNGGSGSITIDLLYPMTLSGTTLTLGSSVTPPVIAGKSVNLFGGVNNGKICMVYNDTTNFRCDTVRVYDISGATWAAPSGTNKSPYAVQTNATLDSNVNDESAFASGSSNSKGYWSLQHADNSACFISFDYANETFNDLTDQVPIRCDTGGGVELWSMSVEPNGNYAVGYYKGSSGRRVFLFDIANDVAILNYETQSTAYYKMIAADVSNNLLGRAFYSPSGAGVAISLHSIVVDESAAGTLAGVEAIGNHTTTSIDYGAGDVALAYNKDSEGWLTYPSVPSIWQRDGYKNIMQEYSTTLKVLFVLLYFGGNPYRLTKTGSIHYTT